MGIVHPYAEGIAAVADEVGKIEDKCRITAFMVAGVFAVHIKIYLLVRTLETDIYSLAGKVVVDNDVFFVPCSPTPITRSLIPAISSIPCVRDGYRLERTLPLFMESPLIINAPFVSWSRRCEKAGKRRKER